MLFNVVFNIAYDQQHVLLEQSKPQRVGNSDLFCGRFRARAVRAVEQICCRLCALSELFSLFSRQACSRDLSPVPCRGSPRNSTISFSSTKSAVAISFVLHDRSIHFSACVLAIASEYKNKIPGF